MHFFTSPIPRHSQKFEKLMFFGVRKKEIEGRDLLCDVREWMSTSCLLLRLGAVRLELDDDLDGTWCGSPE